MVIIPDRPFIGRRRRRRVPPALPVPAAPVLVAASYQPGDSVTLEFDRAIDVSAFLGEQVHVNDPVTLGSLWAALGAATLLDAVTLRVGLEEIDAATGSVVTLTAPATTGIRSVVGALPWAGVSGVELPFG